MAIVLQLSNEDGTSTYNLYSGTLYVIDWRPGVASRNGGTVIETFILAATDTDTNVITAEAAIDTFRRKAIIWKENKNRDESVWLEYKTDNEPTNTKRAFVHSIELQPLSDGAINPLFSVVNAAKYSLVIEREPLWEDNDAQTLVTTNTYTTNGEVLVYSATKGTTFGRIARIRFSGPSSGGQAVNEVWCGIRETFGGTSNFAPIVECEWGTDGTDTSDNAQVGTTSNDSVSRCTFGTSSSLVERIGVTVAQIASNAGTPHTDYDHYVGNYKVILRCRVTGDANVGAQLRWNYQSASGFIQNEEVLGLTHTSYKFIDMGDVSIPPNSYRAGVVGTTGNVQFFEFQIHAELLSGSGNFDMDMFVLIPNDHFVHIKDANMSLDSPTDQVAVFTHEDGSRTVMLQDSTGPIGMPEFSTRNLVFPGFVGGVIVVAGQRSAGHTLGDEVQMNISGRNRWYNHRDA